MQPKPEQPLDGFDVRVTPRGFTVVTLDYFADPEKRDPAWLDQMRALAPSEKEFRREILRDWTSAAGDSFYPEFTSNGGVKTYVRTVPGLLDAPIIRGWDFGYRKPVCIWLQVDANGRVWVLRELVPANIDVYQFTDLVLYLSGELDIQELGPYALHWLQKIEEDPDYPPHPWFQPAGAKPLQWLDYGGHEALIQSDKVEMDSKERCDADVLASRGVQLQAYYAPTKARENVIRKLLRVQPSQNPLSPGLPSLYIDPACPQVIRMFSGALSYPKKGTRGDPIPNEPAKDGHNDNIHDALGYPLVNLIPQVNASQRSLIVVWSDRKPHVIQGPEENLGLHVEAA